MFGFGKKKKQDGEKAKKSTIDKLIMGAIVGGAIGSVVGMSIAPQKGKETREYLTQKGKDAYGKSREVGGKIQDELKDRTTSPKAKKFLSRLKDKIFKSKPKINPQSLAKKDDLKKIPHEIE